MFKLKINYTYIELFTRIQTEEIK